MTEEEWSKVKGMTNSELKKYNKLKRFLRDLYINTDQQKKENKYK
jgi:LysM repeat protein